MHSEFVSDKHIAVVSSPVFGFVKETTTWFWTQILFSFFNNIPASLNRRFHQARSNSAARNIGFLIAARMGLHRRLYGG
jgi:hypothetical protein